MDNITTVMSWVVLTFVLHGLIILCVATNRVIATRLGSGHLVYLERLFEPLMEGGVNFLGLGAVALIGVGKGTELMETSPKLLHYLGWVGVVGLLFFFLAIVRGTGAFFIFCAFVGVCTHLAVIGIIAFHFMRLEGELTIIILSILYTLFLLSWRAISKMLRKLMARFTGEVYMSELESRPLTPHEQHLEKLAKILVGFIPKAMVALFGAGSWGDLIEKSQEILWLLALYGMVAFWTIYGAHLLKRGTLYEIWIWIGSISTLAMTLTAIFHRILPDFPMEFAILWFSFLLVTINLEWQWCDAIIRRFWESLISLHLPFA